MFEALTDKFNAIFKKLRSKGKLSEEDVDAILKELRMVLLESDVHYRVAKDLTSRVRERAVGKEVMELSLIHISFSRFKCGCGS